MGRLGKKRLRSRERWEKKVAQETELETQDIVSEHSEDQGVDREMEELEGDFSESLQEEGEEVVGDNKEEEEEDDSYSPFPQPPFTTGLNSEAIFFQVGGVARAYYELNIDPNVPDKTLFKELSEAFGQTKYSSTIKSVEKKARFGSILLIACSKAQNRPVDPFLRIVNAIYLTEANHYLSTLALPLPICGALKTPEVQIVTTEASTTRSSQPSRASGVKGRLKHEASKPAKLQAEINQLKAEVERLKTENSQLKEEKVTIEKRERDRCDQEMRSITSKLTKEWMQKLDVLEEQLSQIRETVDPKTAKLQCRDCESIKILEGKLNCAEIEIQLSQQRVGELEFEKKNLSESLGVAMKKLEVSQDQMISDLNVSIPLVSSSPAAKRRTQNLENIETRTKSVISVKQDQAESPQAVESLCDGTTHGGKPRTRLSSSKVISSHNKKDFVIASLSRKVLELNQQMKEQNDYFVSLMTVMSSSGD